MPRFIDVRPRKSRNGGVVLAYAGIAVVLGTRGHALAVDLFGPSRTLVSSASASQILSAIASGTMALTAIVFSLVFLGVQYTTSSYSPRIVNVFADRPFLSHALGILTGTFIYALIALRTVDISSGLGIDAYVVIGAFLWLAASVVVLAMLFPRLQRLSISQVIHDLQGVAHAAARRLFPDERARVAPVLGSISQVVRHRGPPRYLVGLDDRRLVHDAREAGAVIEIPLAIGDVVMENDVLVRVRGGRSIAPKRLAAAVWLATERNLANDPSYAIRLLVDAAIRALSPAINDPTTATTVLDEIEAILRSLAARDLENGISCDASGHARLVYETPRWDDLVELALAEIHQYGAESIQVEHRLAALLDDLVAAVPPERRPALERFAAWRATTLESSVWLDATSADRTGLGHARAANHRPGRSGAHKPPSSA
jgi:uncharacterized membrane protein